MLTIGALPPDLRALDDRFVVQARTVAVNGLTWSMDRPRSAEDLISEEDFARDERLPYWADLWPSAIVLAREVLALPGAGRRSLELGAGLGLPSLAALHAGYEALVTDYYADALLFARRNAWRNLGRDVATRLVDWRAWPTEVGRFDLVLAADVLYERPYAPLVARAVVHALAPDGLALIADPGRVALEACLNECTALGATVRERRSVQHEDGAAKHTITIHEVRLG
ncbi:MAG: methyltransferase domain-containing protein [Gemmatimonadaceae bacterium]|nr:methyltransferase domain-containing protein [Gemmatimonadaceae bacterium]